MATGNAASIFPQGYVADVVQAVFNSPVSAPELQEHFCRGLLGSKTGYGIRCFGGSYAGLDARSVYATDLSCAWPIKVAVDARGGEQVSFLDAVAVDVRLFCFLDFSLPAFLLQGGKPAQ